MGIFTGNLLVRNVLILVLSSWKILFQRNEMVGQHIPPLFIFIIYFLIYNSPIKNEITRLDNLVNIKVNHNWILIIMLILEFYIILYYILDINDANDGITIKLTINTFTICKKRFVF